MANAKIKTTTSTTSYVIVEESAYKAKDGDNSVGVRFLDHPPTSAEINEFIDYYGFDDDDVVVIELGRVGKVTREVTINFDD